MPKFYVSSEQIHQDRAEISGPEARHILRVLRLGVGDKLELFDGTGALWQARIEKVERGRLAAKLLEKYLPQVESSLELTLIQALIKSDKLELIIRAATELGVSRIIIVRTARARRSSQASLKNRILRWQKVTKEAAKQCGRARLPEIKLCGWEELWRQGVEANLKLLLWETEQHRGLGEALAQPAGRDPATPPQQVVLLVGPEGGFNPDEVVQAQAAGYIPVSLGPRILRAETATLAALALIQYELGDLGIRPPP